MKHTCLLHAFHSLLKEQIIIPWQIQAHCQSFFWTNTVRCQVEQQNFDSQKSLSIRDSKVPKKQIESYEIYLYFLKLDCSLPKTFFCTKKENSTGSILVPSLNCKFELYKHFNSPTVAASRPG